MQFVKKSTFQRGVVHIPLVFAVVLLAAAGLGYFSWQKGYIQFNYPSTQPSDVQSQPEEGGSTDQPVKQTPDNGGWETYNYDDIGLTFSAPKNLEVTKQEQNPGDVNLFIQNYGFNSPIPNDYYQLYITFNPKAGSQGITLEMLKTDLDSSSLEEIAIDTYPAIRGKVKGQRDRFITYIMRGDTLISAFTAEPTKENEELSNNILSTFKFSQP
jgi:hypothetical protein